MFMGDFNEVLSDDEHVSQRRHRPNWQMENFCQVVNDCRMFDLGYSGFKFTWCNNFITPNSTRARLDRCLVSNDWMDRLPQAAVKHFSTNTSDHLPLLLLWGEQTVGQNKQKNAFGLREVGFAQIEERKIGEGSFDHQGEVGGIRYPTTRHDK
ncbi:hypothetical protein LIER_40096 [Lithospermum erythrorhizon]|uniref:Uncharacterized protein n=1 Tax=Lithospermum erythrorhizon TaxID=34254 RepID=A0AAV3QPL8_LITER